MPNSELSERKSLIQSYALINRLTEKQVAASTNAKQKSVFLREFDFSSTK